MPITKYLMICCLSAGIIAPMKGDSADSFNAGPLYDEFALTLAPGRRTEALGPFFDLEHKESQTQWAVPPLFSYTHDAGTDSEEFDFAYPVLTYDRFGTEHRFQFFQLLSFAGGQNQQEISSRRFTLFPIYFQQRSADPDQNYTALFPFYGHVKNRLLRDDVRVVMFPLYSRTRKRDVVTDNYLYPVFHLRHGDALRGWQVWPLTGHQHKDVTQRTNRFDEVETIGGHDRWFVLWPLFLNEHTGLGTDNPQWQQASLPAYTLLRSTNRDASTVLWPFFSYIDDREKKYREWHAPWPFVVFARGEGKTTTRFMPLFSQARSATLVSDFYLWPVYKYNRVNSPPLDRKRTRILLFLYSDINAKNTETGAAQRRTDLWPLFTRRRDFDGNQRLQIFAPIEPVLPNNKSIERDYSPLWSVWRSERNAQSGAASQSLLWNLYRGESAPAAKKYSLLFGLFQYQSSVEGKRWRLFYVPFGKAAAPRDGQPKPAAMDTRE